MHIHARGKDETELEGAEYRDADTASSNKFLESKYEPFAETTPANMHTIYDTAPAQQKQHAYAITVTPVQETQSTRSKYSAMATEQAYLCSKGNACGTETQCLYITCTACAALYQVFSSTQQRSIESHRVFSSAW